MNGHGRHLLVAFGVVLAITLVLNDYLASPAYGEALSSTGYITHLGLLLLVIAYATYLKYEASVLKEKLTVYRQAWRQIPGGIAVLKKNRVVETCAAVELFEIFGLESGGQDGGVPATVLPIRREEKREYCGKQCYADRFVIPLTGLPGGYSTEFLLDASERVRRTRQRESEYVQMIKILVNMFEIKDPYSHGHSEVVSHLAQELAEALGLSEAEIGTVSKAALLHDIGKIIIPTEILGKAEELTADELEKIQTHACVGADILSGMELFREEAVIVRHHHERFDGRGYPGGLSGREIPAGSRIIAVVDAFEAITAGRSIKGKRNIESTLAVLEAEKGRQFDPEIVEVFITMVRTERTARE